MVTDRLYYRQTALVNVYIRFCRYISAQTVCSQTQRVPKVSFICWSFSGVVEYFIWSFTEIANNMCDTRFSGIYFLSEFAHFQPEVICRFLSFRCLERFVRYYTLCVLTTSPSTVCFAVLVYLTENLIMVALVLNYVNKTACSYRKGGRVDRGVNLPSPYFLSQFLPPP